MVGKSPAMTRKKWFNVTGISSKDGSPTVLSTILEEFGGLTPSPLGLAAQH
jgi:hypothetical protein